MPSIIEQAHAAALARVAELERMIAGYQRECNEVEQQLGKALGYPLADHTICARCDPVTGCTCGTPVTIVGEHTPASIAVEAAKRIAELEKEDLDNLHELDLLRSAIEEEQEKNAALVAALHLAKEWIAGKHDIGFVEARMDAALAGTSDLIANVRQHALEEAAKACDAVIQDFFSPEYAGNNPRSSFAERFGAGQCKQAICTLMDKEPQR